MRTYVYGAALFAAAHMAAIGALKAEMLHYKATLTAAAETPPTTSTGSGTLTATFDTDSKKLEWTANYSGLTGPGGRRPFPWARARRQGRADRSAAPSPARQPDEGFGDADRRPGQGPDGRHDVLQHPHRREQAGRDPRPDGKGDVRRAESVSKALDGGRAQAAGAEAFSIA